MKNRLLKIKGILLISLLLTWGCLEQIDLEVDPEFQLNTVIQGKLVIGNPSTVFVRISRLFDFSGNGRENVLVRYVRLFDDQGNEVDLERGEVVGNYSIELAPDDPRMPIEQGRSYYIEVSTFDGNIYRSQPETIQPVPEVTDLTYQEIQKEILGADDVLRESPFIEFRLTTPLDAPNGDIYLRWIAERTIKLTDTPESSEVPDDGQPNKVCYITERGDLRSLPVASSTTFAGEVVDFPVYEELKNHLFSEGYVLTVYQESLSELAYNYWRDVGSLINRQGTIFEPPVGKVRSNLSNVQEDGPEPFGFFYVTQQDTARIYIAPEDVGNPPMRCPIPPPSTPSPGFSYCASNPVCCDCLSVPGSQLTPPDFWIE